MPQLSMSMLEAYDAVAEARNVKPVVHYIDPLYIEVGQRATVTPVNHTNPLPNQFVINGQIAHTSRVLAYDQTTGVFETLNTIYKPAENIVV